MWVKLLIILMLLAIITALFSALINLLRPQSAAPLRTVRALTVRIALSIVLFMLLMLGFHFGLIPRGG